MAIILEGVYCQGEVMSVINSLTPEDKCLVEKSLIFRKYSSFELYFILPQVFKNQYKRLNVPFEALKSF